jgi:hypothetical protein
MKSHVHLLNALAALGAVLALAGCGGGSSSDSGASIGAGTNPPPDGSTGAAASTPTTPGIWKGTIASTGTGQASGVVAMTDPAGRTAWASTDGRVWTGQLPLHGERFEAEFVGHMSAGAQFPDGTSRGPASMTFEHHSAIGADGHYTGNGDSGVFNMSLSPMWSTPASLESAAGSYMRTTSNGYAMSMNINSMGQLTGSDTFGCVLSGTVTVPDPAHNLYRIDADVSSCGTLDGHYQGLGALLDADEMQEWMSDMHPLEHGAHSHGGHGMGGPHMRGNNTVPSGQHNLFMFSMFNDRGAIMDALVK